MIEWLTVTESGRDTWYNQPVYIGDKEDWNLEETEKRRDTGLNNPRFPWGLDGALDPRSNQSRLGKSTFDSGRYRCCEDMHDCGVFAAVQQGLRTHGISNVSGHTETMLITNGSAKRSEVHRDLSSALHRGERG